MEDPNVKNALPAMMEALDMSEAQADAGETEPLDGFLDELRESIGRMEARLAGHDTAAD